MIIELDKSLKIKTPWEEKDLLENLSYKEKFNLKSVHFSTVVEEVQHENYINYLAYCWANHRAPVFTPDVLWFTLLNELAGIIKENVESLRHLFSEKSEKQEILVQGVDPYNLPLDLIAGELKKLVPTDVDLFLPLFSTTDNEARLAHYAAFADAMSPYYNYGMFLCGFPYIKIEGNKEDYWAIYYNWQKISLLFKKSDSHFRIEEKYFVAVESLLFELCRNLTVNSKSFWSKIFKAERCGSGSDIEVDGWFSSIFRKQPKHPRKPSNFASHLSKVDYKVIDLDREFTRYHGLFSSRAENELLVPQFGWFCVEKTKPEPKVSQDLKDAMEFTTYILKR